ncbi:MAG: transcriptional regulator [Acidobacteria bacterium]|nr:transcriptional regulator [Acidobacteriota bacterium]
MTRKYLILLGILLALGSLAWAGQWATLGPDGGDVRSLSYNPANPDQILLGTSTGTIFQSKDGGRTWARFAHLGSGDDYVIDHIAIDPQNPNTMYAGVWSVDNQQAGDVFRTRDGGKNWEALPDMHGKSVRAMSLAPSDAKVLIVGALDGVYRSNDGGSKWSRISPAAHNDIKNIESLAVDPKDPNVVYAGTWHLAWKTADGGANWAHIKNGMIEDSDVFSIIVDASNPSVVFASACSGIYKSESAGDLFRKIPGIPFSARRTRVLKQDPVNPAIVYAGTTEGLWKTSDSGKTWKRVSNPTVVVNDVLIDPRNSSRVLLATDRSGVLASDDAAQSFVASNRGYAHRYVTSILADNHNPGTILVGVVNDREWGGVFVSKDGGQHWQQKSSGLGGRDVFTLKQANDGSLIAGTNRGIFLLERNAVEWKPINTILTEKTSVKKVKKGAKLVSVPSKTVTRSVLEARVNDIEVTPKHWLAATSTGFFLSTDQGKSWTGGELLGNRDFVSVQSSGDHWVVATRSNVLVSSNVGTTWQQSGLASYVTSIREVTLTPENHILVASREGAFRSSDAGASWEHLVNGIPDKNISSISYDESQKRLLATSPTTGVVFESRDNGRSWRRGPDTGYPLRRVSAVGGRLLAATPFDGVVIQPENDTQSAAVEAGSSTR